MSQYAIWFMKQALPLTRRRQGSYCIGMAQNYEEILITDRKLQSLTIGCIAPVSVVFFGCTMLHEKRSYLCNSLIFSVAGAGIEPATS